MIRPLSPVRPAAAKAGAVDVNVTLTMNDGTVCRPRLSDGRLVVVGETKPVVPELRAGPPAGFRVLDEIEPWPKQRTTAASPPPGPPPVEEQAPLW